MNEVVAKHQQVPVLAWFLTEVVFTSATGVKIYPDSDLDEAGGLFFFCPKVWVKRIERISTNKNRGFIF